MTPRFAFILLLVVLTACAPAHAWHGSVYEPAPAAPTLGLQTTGGRPFQLTDHAGQVVLIYFGYTFCPDVCPATLSELNSLSESLDAPERVQVVFVTVDPTRDSADAIDSYLSRFNPEFIGLTGSESALEAAMESYGVFAARDPGGTEADYLMTHTSRVFLVDPQGRLRANYTFDVPPEDILADVKYLLGSG